MNISYVIKIRELLLYLKYPICVNLGFRSSQQSKPCIEPKSMCRREMRVNAFSIISRFEKVYGN